jgi:hypothetical protein
MNRLILALALCAPVALISCAHPTVQTPAPPQSLDLRLARSLADAQAAIEQASALVATKPALKDPVNRVRAAYNTALDAYTVYHHAVVAGGTPDATAIQAQIAELTQSIAALVGMFK